MSCFDRWLALSIGNSRLHWAQFSGNDLQQTWDTPHLSATDVQQLIATQFTKSAFHPSLHDNADGAHMPLWIASVVSQQSLLWQKYDAATFITLEQVPLAGLYPTLGIDRALAALGAIALMHSPVLVIDAGTALTFTSVDSARLIGGAILPGLGLQFQTLQQATAALPNALPAALPASEERVAPQLLPPRWALNTTDAIASGIIYTLVAGLQAFVNDWWQQFPASPVLLTGGDRDRLYAYLTATMPAMASKLTVEPQLIFWGMRSVRGESLKAEG
ncbi:pantothenate kinase [Leptolyngbya sp. FACHB-321]|uniref:pantothenate kinase n=1 Tax=Leptolyngbya sp. FACHB-321 TaxID=2692807 RepID=UPI0016851FC1|nr:pantothenate kinase [Leptolyngbya sp. FACHB-321]MBD2038004.1 pantothenate kinase [Leptolyngbya sp. FACHB-321]